MNWLDKIRSTRKTLTDALRREQQDENNPPYEEDVAFLRSLIAMTEVIEEIGHQARTPLIDRADERQRGQLDGM